MFVLGLDYETTGLDHAKDRVLEIGAVVWDMRARAAVHFHSDYVLGPDWPLPDAEAQAITGIDPEWVRKFAVSDVDALTKLNKIASQCSYIVAHNAEFEMNFTMNWLKRNGDPHPELKKLPWIDTKIHLPYPSKISVRDLVSLCSHHGFFNPHPHRAFWDAWAMLKIMDQYAERFDEVVANSQSPRFKVWSKGITFNTKDLPKSLGYYWDGATKRWWFPCKESELDDAINKAKQKGFEVETQAEPICTTLEELEKICERASEEKGKNG